MSKLEVDEELHESFKTHCLAQSESMKDLVERLIKRELEGANAAAEKHAAEALERRRIEELRQRRLRLAKRLAPLPSDPRDPYTRPPFWAATGYQPPAPSVVKPKVEAPDEYTFTLN